MRRRSRPDRSRARRRRGGARGSERRWLAWLGAGLLVALATATVVSLRPRLDDVPADPTAERRAPDLRTVEERAFGEAIDAVAYCGSCHMFPDPEHLPRGSWRRIVEHMNAVIEQNDLGRALSAEEIEVVVEWYTRRAPVRVRQLDDEGSESPLRFEPRPFGTGPLRGVDGGPGRESSAARWRSAARTRHRSGGPARRRSSRSGVARRRSVRHRGENRANRRSQDATVASFGWGARGTRSVGCGTREAPRPRS